MFDPTGTIRQAGIGELGIYHDGTRFLSLFEIALHRRRPLLLGSTVRNDGVLVVDLANPDLPEFAEGALGRESLHVSSTSFLWAAGWYARFHVHNYAHRTVELDLAMLFGADFVDVFEVRGMKRERRGKLRRPHIEHGVITLAYEGIDEVLRTTKITLTPQPRRLTGSRAEFRIQLSPGEVSVIELRAMFGVDGDPEGIAFDEALALVTSEVEMRHARSARIASSNERFDAWLDRSASDVEMMVTHTEVGPYPYAGVPWYSTAFGRDGLITAYQMLWRDPELARGVLAYLASTQATAHDPERDAEPGKIVHEIRLGEMAALGEIPFGRYYGSVDATPLFIVLAEAYWRRTADRAGVETLWPHVVRALDWLDDHGDIDGDGFVEYKQRSSRGLVAQGWKDSHDSISHADGTIAEGPIALCEVQGYVFAARRAAAELARVMGYDRDAVHLEAAADSLRRHFERTFWSERLGTYVLALDGAKRPCEVRASNAGHLLWSGIVDPSRAARVADVLFSPTSFTGWGMRTLDATAARFNPISYHNGSVWPHDNALIAMGLARYGFKRAAARLLSTLFEASHHFDLGRMPELFCGFARRSFEGPTLYPVACSPQAWAAGSAFLLLQACLGLDVDATRRRVLLDRPYLPASIAHLRIRDLRVADSHIDLACHRREDDVSIELEHRSGDVEVAVIK